MPLRILVKDSLEGFSEEHFEELCQVSSREASKDLCKDIFKELPNDFSKNLPQEYPK